MRYGLAMMQGSNGFWRMRRNDGPLTVDDFAFVSDAAPTAPSPGEITVRARYIALDPYLARAMRSWIGEVPEWRDGTVHGRLVGEVIASCDERYRIGDPVLAVGRWQQLQNIPVARVEAIAASVTPPRLTLGMLGRSGLTAWVGLHLACPVAGETLLVSAASGPVGSIVGQLAKNRGLRVIGIAGGMDKCAYVTDVLGFDACLDHHLPDLPASIAHAAPDGIDILFENVGGPSLDPALPAMAKFGRIMLCGLVAHYNDDAALQLANFRHLLYGAITLRGFVTADHTHLFPQALAELVEEVAGGRIVHRETITEGLDRAPAAYLAMLRGVGLGKRLIRL